MVDLIRYNKDLANIKSWEQFEKIARDKSTDKERGDLFEQFCFLWFKTDSFYRRQIKNIWHYSNVPTKIKNHLNLPNDDEGIDIIIETKNDGFYSVQAKYRSNYNKNIVRSDVTTFESLSYRSCKNINNAIVITTRNKPTKNELMPDITWIDRSHLEILDEEDNWKKINDLASEKKYELSYPKTPHNYQKKLLDGLEKYFTKGNNRGKLIIPCGTGKTLLSFWLHRKLNPKKILIAVPSLALIRQFIDEWAKEIDSLNLDYEWSIVCSDQSTGTNSNDSDNYMSNSSDLGIKVTTNVDQLTRILRKNKKQIIITTYQSGEVIAQSSRLSKTKFDLAIFDEAHRTVGRKNKLFSHMLFDENINIKNRLFMTATERFFLGNSEDIVSMNNSELYGKIAGCLTYKQALELPPSESPICDYKISTINITESEIRALWESNKILSISKKYNELDEITTRHLATALAVDKLYKDKGVRLSISFHNSLQKAKDFKNLISELSEQFESFSKIDTFYIRGDYNAQRKKRILKDFSNSGSGLIANSRCLTEGINVTNVDSVIFSDPKKSKIDIVQAVGRALRKDKNFISRKGMQKQIGIILIPVIIPDEIVLEDFINNAFSDVIQIISSLAIQDERIIDYIKAIHEGQKPSSNIIDIDTSIKVPININFEEISEEIRIKVWNRTSRLNWKPIDEAKKIIHPLGIKSVSEWEKYKLSGDLPLDIPPNPQISYKILGTWKGFIDFLGNEPQTPVDGWLSLEELKDFAKNKNIKSQSEWFRYVKNNTIPKRVPKAPHLVYKNWISWNDFLEKPPQTPKGGWIDIEDLKILLKKLNIKSQSDFRKLIKDKKIVKKYKIPSTPEKTYKRMGKWKSWYDLLSKRNPTPEKYAPFQKAKEIARKFNIKTQAEWAEFAKSKNKPHNIPAGVVRIYSRTNEWINWADFLGKDPLIPFGGWRSITEAKKIIHPMKISSREEYKKLHRENKIPGDIPKAPNSSYKQYGWKSWADFLGK